MNARRPLIVKTLADLLVCAAPELCDVDKLHARLSALTSDQRLAAEGWARVRIAARGDAERMPSMPPCITWLYQRLTIHPEEPCH